jgi:hypothetical protein
LSFMDLVTGLCVGLMLITAYEGSLKVKALVVALGVLTFVVPATFRSAAVSFGSFVARVVIALACYLYLRSHRKIR